MATRAKKAAKTRVREGGDRLVRITNGTQYIVQANTTFGIVRFGAKDEAVVMTLSQAVDYLADIRRFGVHKLWAELLEDQSL